MRLYKVTSDLRLVFSLGEDFNAPVGSLKYRQVWKDKLSDSSTFQVPIGHENPKYVQNKTRYIKNFGKGNMFLYDDDDTRIGKK